MDSVYCYVCRHFPQAKTDVAFTETGFNNRSHCERLERHAKTDSHKTSMVAWEDWKKTQKSGGIANLLLEGHSKFVEENRHYIGCVANIVQLIARQGLAFRGHHENEQSSNRGNFLEIIELISKYDTVVNNKLHGPKMLFTPIKIFKMSSLIL